MRFKLDENFGRAAATLLTQAGHDVATVVAEGLAGAPDRVVLAAAHGEQRCWVTLDLEFANPLLFDPRDYSGIVVVRLPAQPTLTDLWAAMATLTRAVAMQQPAGRLWIIHRDRLREYQPKD